MVKHTFHCQFPALVVEGSNIALTYSPFWGLGAAPFVVNCQLSIIPPFSPRDAINRRLYCCLPHRIPHIPHLIPHTPYPTPHTSHPIVNCQLFSKPPTQPHIPMPWQCRIIIPWLGRAKCFGIYNNHGGIMRVGNIVYTYI